QVMLSLIPKSAALLDLALDACIDRQEINARVARRCRQLLDAGLRPGGRLAVCHDDGIAALIDLLAGWHVGAVPGPLSTSLGGAERRRLAQRVRPALWIGEGAPGIGALEPASANGRQAPVPDLPPAAVVTPDAPALILMTSGTTSEPKGVVLSHRALRER